MPQSDEIGHYRLMDSFPFDRWRCYNYGLKLHDCINLSRVVALLGRGIERGTVRVRMRGSCRRRASEKGRGGEEGKGEGRRRGGGTPTVYLIKAVSVVLGIRRKRDKRLWQAD